MQRFRRAIYVLLTVTLTGAVVYAQESPGRVVSNGRAIEAISTPSRDVTLSFLAAGEVSEVLVRVGDEVESDALLVRKNEKVERIKTAQLKAKAENRTRIEAAEANLAQKKVNLEKLQWASRQGAATELEVEQARLDVVIQELSLELAKFEHQQDVLKYQEALAQLERMELRSPIDGTVESIEVEPGESVDALADVARVVDTGTLWMNVPVPLSTARNLSVGDSAVVLFPGDDQTRVTQRGKIIHIASVADAASNTLRVRVEASNPSKRPAGEQVRVRFSSNSHAAESE